MNPKNLLIGIGIIDLIIGIVFFFGKEAILTSAIVGIGEEGLRVGSIFLEVIAVLFAGIAIIEFLSRNIEISASKKVLLGSGFGHLPMFVLLIRDTIIAQSGGGPPIPLVIVHILIIASALYVGFKAVSPESD